MPDLRIIRRARGAVADKYNILFLGDGFTPGDIARFNRSVKQIATRMFWQRPFNLRGMRRHFNVYSSYAVSPSSGITCQASVDIDGKPATGAAAIGVPAAKTTRFGMYYEGPYTRVINAQNHNTIPDYIATLTHPDPAERGPGAHIPGCWATGGKSFGFVIVLINDDLDGGSAVGPAGGPDYACSVSLGHRDRLNISSHAPLEHEPSSARNRWGESAAVTIHELGHTAFNLADEYVQTNFDPASPENNICSVAQGRGGPPSLTFWANLKWDRDRFPGGPRIIANRERDQILPTLAVPPGPAHATAAAAATQVSSHCPGGGGPSPFQQRMFPRAGRAPPMAHTWKWIGIYQGAKSSHCDIYRPAGDCKMRNNRYGGEQFPRQKLRHVQFCYVCKYEIVNKIDPTLLPDLSRRMYP